MYNFHEKLVDYEQSYQWLKFGNIKKETESTIVAAQSQAISRNYFKNTIFKEEVDSECRLCKQHEEILVYILCRQMYTVLCYLPQFLLNAAQHVSSLYKAHLQWLFH
jgi:hypothetical protein